MTDIPENVTLEFLARQNQRILNEYKDIAANNQRILSEYKDIALSNVRIQNEYRDIALSNARIQNEYKDIAANNIRILNELSEMRKDVSRIPMIEHDIKELQISFATIRADQRQQDRITNLETRVKKLEEA